jgi:transposase
MKIHTIGIDLGKTSFHLVGLNERGEVVVRKRFSRAQLCASPPTGRSM